MEHTNLDYEFVCVILCVDHWATNNTRRKIVLNLGGRFATGVVSWVNLHVDASFAAKKAAFGR